MQDFGENWERIFKKSKQEKEADDNSANGEADRPDTGTNPATETDGRDTL
jgi:hypothetical protein